MNGIQICVLHTLLLCVWHSWDMRNDGNFRLSVVGVSCHWICGYRASYSFFSIWTAFRCLLFRMSLLHLILQTENLSINSLHIWEKPFYPTAYNIQWQKSNVCYFIKMCDAATNTYTKTRSTTKKPKLWFWLVELSANEWALAKCTSLNGLSFMSCKT